MTQFEAAEDAAAYGAGILHGDSVRLPALRESDLPLLTRWWSDPEWSALQGSTIKPCPAAATEDMFRQWSGNTESESAGQGLGTDAVRNTAGY